MSKVMLSSSSQYNSISEVINKLSFREISNWIKGKWLENSFLIGCEDLKLYYRNLTDVCNFKNKSEHNIPDIIVNDSIVFELKNWSNKYKIKMHMALSQIMYRLLPYWNLEKYLIISNPKWCKGVKEWLLALGIKIYELHYVVTKEEFVNGKAINNIKNILKSVLGYYHSIRYKMRCYVNKCKIYIESPISKILNSFKAIFQQSKTILCLNFKQNKPNNQILPEPNKATLLNCIDNLKQNLRRVWNIILKEYKKFNIEPIYTDRIKHSIIRYYDSPYISSIDYKKACYSIALTNLSIDLTRSIHNHDQSLSLVG